MRDTPKRLHLPAVMVVKLTVTKAGDEDGPAATLRVEFVIGDGAFSLGTDAPCRVLFPPSQGVERCHCSLSLRSPSSATRGAEHSEWELTPRDGIVRVPTLASTDDGGFCQVFALQSTQSNLVYMGGSLEHGNKHVLAPGDGGGARALCARMAAAAVRGALC